MAAAVAPGTPAAAPAAPAVEADAGGDEAVTAADHGLAALLSGPLDEAAEEAAAEPTDATEGDPEAAEEDAEPAEPKPDPMPDDVLFSEKALATKEGVLKAKGRLLELRKQQHEKFVEIKAYDHRVKLKATKLTARKNAFLAEKGQHDLLINNVRVNLQGLHSGDPDTILTALGHLTGQDGLKAYELLTSRIINKGRPVLDPQVQALIDQQQAQIEELKSGFQTREVQAKAGQITQQIEQHKRAIGGVITGNATQLPHLARLYGEDAQQVVDYIAEDIIENAKRGTPVDKSTYFVNLERQLASRFGAGAPQGDGGGPAPKQPPTVQRSPGQSVGPRTAAASNPRVPNEDEALRALSQDEAFMSSLFG